MDLSAVAGHVPVIRCRKPLPVRARAFRQLAPGYRRFRAMDPVQVVVEEEKRVRRGSFALLHQPPLARSLEASVSAGLAGLSGS